MLSFRKTPLASSLVCQPLLWDWLPAPFPSLGAAFPAVITDTAATDPHPGQLQRCSAERLGKAEATVDLAAAEWRYKRVPNAGLTGCCPCQGCLPMHGFLCGSGSAATVEREPPGPPSVTELTRLHLKAKLSSLLSACEEKSEITFRQIIFRENNKNKN